MRGRDAGRWRWAVLAVLAAIVVMVQPPAGRADAGPVPTENAQPGTPGWYAQTAPQGTEADQYAGRVLSIDGWIGSLSLAPGEQADFHVGSASGVRYRIEVYRLGWYGGAGARLMTCLPSCSTDKAGIVQPLPPAPDPATGEVRSGWSATDSLSIPAAWPSGFYMAALKVTSGTGSGSVRRLPFVVRAPASQTSRIAVIVPVNTWAAYNGWGGKALYDNHSADGVRASQVSFERPWMEGVEISNWRYSEYPLIRFLERHDLDVSYVTDADVSLTPGILAGHRVVMTSGHGEYWTHEERDALDAARDAGQNLAFMGANTGYWQVRYANGGRSMIGYKSALDPIADPALKTNHFRDVGRPECELLGVQYNNTGWSLGTSAALGVVAASLPDPWLSGTGFTAGATMTDTMGYEWDQVTPGCVTPPLTRLFHWETSGWPSADSVRYTAPSGAKVFAAGSLQFSWGLDGWRYNSAPAAPDARLESFMMRMLTDMGGAGEIIPPPPSLTVSPGTAGVQTGATQQFTATLQNATGAVEWSVDGVPGGDATVGTVSASGLYTAPAAVPAGGTVSVRATHPASGATDAAAVTVAAPSAPQIVTPPAAQSVVAGATATFTAGASGIPAPAVQWQVSTDAGATYADISGATAGTLTLSGVTSAQSGNRYRAVFTNSEGTATTAEATLTVTVVITAPQITAQPVSRSVVAGAGATFTAAASGTPAPTVQWQISTDAGATYADIAEATSPTLALNAVTAAQNGNRYRAVFANSAGPVTSAAATLLVTTAAGAPVNDAFANALPLAGATGTVGGGNVAATKEAGEYATQAGNAGGRSIWYSWTPSASGTATIDTIGSPFDTTLGVYTGTAVGALTLLAANDDVSGGTASRVSVTVTAGTTYRISVDGFNAATGAVTLHWTGPVPGATPANDAFAGAQTLTGATGTLTGSNAGATKEAGEPATTAGNAGGGSVWYSWTPASSGSATIDTVGSSFDTILGVYTGTAVGALTLRASNDDIASGNNASRVTLTVTAGTTYRISVDGYNNARGAITLNWAVEIIGNKSIEEDIFEMFNKKDIVKNYTKIPVVHGVGGSGPRNGDTVWPEENFMIIVYCNDDESEKILEAVKEIKKYFKDEGLKLFESELVCSV